MENTVLNLMYASSLTDLCEVNSSFDSGILRIAYPGVNRNGSFISKETFEKCLKTIFNCPVVCNYDREMDSLGGHDMEVVKTKDGDLSLVNLTTPVGCIPESSRIFWEDVTEEDGAVNEYLCAEVLLWKRQEAYRKLKEDGISAHSMEITVKDGENIDGVYVIKDFEFTAFALIGVTPCFESSSLHLFSKQAFKEQLSLMMQELKDSFALVETPECGDDDKKEKEFSTEGGDKMLDKNELIAKYGIDVSSLDFSIDDFTYEELEEKFKEMTKDDNGDDGRFALLSNLVEEVTRTLSEVKIRTEWGEYSRYRFADLDTELSEVYAWDTEDWLLYGFKYEMNGDNVSIDFEGKKRKKYVIADFDEGEQPSPFGEFFTMLSQKLSDNADLEHKYQEAIANANSMTEELESLREFKAETERSIAENKREELFAKFADLAGDEAFEELKATALEMDINTLEEKCYAIRGRNTSGKFNLNEEVSKTPKLKVERENDKTDEPYGGIFEKYGFSTEK